MNLSRTQTARSKQRLATLWLVGSGILFFILLFQTSMRVFAESGGEVVTWFLPHILPTLSLVVGALVLDWVKGQHAVPSIRSYLFKVTFWLSAAYLASILFLFLIWPFSETREIDIFRQSNLFLGPFQGLVAGSMGAFFSNGAQERLGSPEDVDPN